MPDNDSSARGLVETLIRVAVSVTATAGFALVLNLCLDLP
jgi:hypothetical protein